MSRSEPAEVSCIATGATRRTIDLEDVRPIALPGGTAIFAQSYTETPHGTQIQSGEVPVCVAGLCSPTDLRASLGALGFDAETTERALRHELEGDSATRAVAAAEREAGNAEVLA